MNIYIYIIYTPGLMMSSHMCLVMFGISRWIQVVILVMVKCQQPAWCPSRMLRYHLFFHDHSPYVARFDQGTFTGWVKKLDVVCVDQLKHFFLCWRKHVLWNKPHWFAVMVGSCGNWNGPFLWLTLQHVSTQRYGESIKFITWLFPFKYYHGHPPKS